jgi:hypothetical protein
MTLRQLVPVIVVILAAGATLVAQTGESSGVVVLDTIGVWRMYHTLKPPVFLGPDGLKPVAITGAESDAWKKILTADTPPAPKDWTAPDFDDSTWLRGPALRACHSPLVAQLCLRGKFFVEDPAKVGPLTLAVDYQGGAIVSLNGREVKRLHVPAGAGDLLAEPYGEDAYVSEKGELLSLRGVMPQLTAGLSAEAQRRYGVRIRSGKVELPKADLRKGLNIVTVEIIRAPYHPVLEAHQAKHEYKSGDQTVDLSWNTCEVRRIRLTANKADGLTIGATRPAGVQVWNSDPMATDYDLDFGDPAEPLRPVRIVAPRGGAASGKVVVGSSQALKSLKAAVGDLKGGDGAAIPASAVRVRYALAWNQRAEPLTTEFNFELFPYPAPVEALVALSDVPLNEFPVRTKPLDAVLPTDRDMATARRYGTGVNVYPRDAGQPAPVFGAVVPVWVTVSVPREAKAGLYRGTLTIEAGGARVAEAPIEVTVADFALGRPADFRTWVEVVESPDTLAVHYNVPLWSDQHFQMISDALKYLGDVGSRVVYVPLVAQTNLGNAETMVRWIKKGDGYDFDFKVMDRYLDLVEKQMGKPKVVVFMVWDLHLGADGTGPRSQYNERAVGKSPMVTLLDPATGKTENTHLTPYEDAGGKAPWVSLFAQLRERMKTRGLEQTMTLGMLSDLWPSKEQTVALKEISGDLPWSIAAHGSYYTQERALHDIARIGYHAHAFGTNYGYTKSLMGWKQDVLHNSFERWGNIPTTPPIRWRSFTDIAITGSVRGVARIGGDFWPVQFKGRSGQATWAQVWGRYPEADLKQLSLKTALLAPGPNGPVAGARYEAFREGLQESEARIAIERALSNAELRKKLDPALAQACDKMLADRLNDMWRSVSPLQIGPNGSHSLAAWRGVSTGVAGYAWFLSSGWQAKTAELFRLAGEVQKAVGE